METYTICGQEFEIPKGGWPKLETMKGIEEAQRCKFIIYKKPSRKLYYQYYRWCEQEIIPFVAVNLSSKYAQVELDMDLGHGPRLDSSKSLSQIGGNAIQNIFWKYQIETLKGCSSSVGCNSCYGRKMQREHILRVARAIFCIAIEHAVPHDGDNCYRGSLDPHWPMRREKKATECCGAVKEYLSKHPKMTFARWLKFQIGRNDPIGDFAADVKDDKDHPKGEATFDTWRKYLYSNTRACGEAIEAFEQAFAEYDFECENIKPQKIEKRNLHYQDIIKVRNRFPLAQHRNKLAQVVDMPMLNGPPLLFISNPDTADNILIEMRMLKSRELVLCTLEDMGKPLLVYRTWPTDEQPNWEIEAEKRATQIAEATSEKVNNLLALYDCEKPVVYPHVSNIPDGTEGIYFLWNDSKLEYIGQSSSIKRRLYNSHHAYNRNTHVIGIAPISNKTLRHAIESALIALMHPSQNVKGNPNYV